jgi:dienelactone hydrolase
MANWASVFSCALAIPALFAQESLVLDQLQERAREALDAIPRAHTKTAADVARPRIRQQLEDAMGLRRMPWPPRVKAQVVGSLQGRGYRIEKLVWESLPGVRVPAHLYLPERLSGRAPAILFYNGHWYSDSKSRPDFQTFCINMARQGFVVLTWDPFGQGERGISNRDHRRTELLLAGVAQQGIAEYETQGALNYLLSRPDVDPQRIGMTGASGGGYNTWISAALDDRIKVAVPVVGTSDFFEQISVTRSLDWYRANEHCHFIPGLIRFANNHELLAAVAPRPLLIINAAEDQSFPIGGARMLHEYGRGLYQSYDAGGKIALFEDSSSGHGYQQKKREAAYGWFLKWLAGRGDGSPVSEPATRTLPFDSADLRCFPPGRNEASGPGLVAFARKLVPTQSPGRIDPIILEGMACPRTALPPKGASRGTLLAVLDAGREAAATDEVLRQHRSEGWTVVAVDVRGIGELKLSQPGWAFAVSLLLNENFAANQAADLLRAVRETAATALYARGHNASLAAAYAVAQPAAAKLEWATLSGGFVSFQQFLERPESHSVSFRLIADEQDRKLPLDREIPMHYFVFDVLRRFDIPDLLARSRARVTVTDPIDGDWKPLTAEAARRWLPARVTVKNSQ